ncbi:hypothetical protein BS47DRAFT_1295030 [Hydnum rufescens UP504]|uniref:Uncharacterized protein n=1 Tax=Hydnum rufescens UP504 TaxID=1448309 RepID=A0A9P6AYY5_9AGAM|nr:hypothetical protein BS47DRAFT_1295030 [Hydnum rufescens UP504]
MLNALPQESNAVVDMAESSHTLTILLSTIHNPPRNLPPPRSRPLFKVGAPESYEIPFSPIPDLIPFPLLRELLYPLADKFQFSASLTSALHSHLAAHAPTMSLETYALASFLALTSIANDASQYLLEPKLSTMPLERIRLIPTADAYHCLLQLQTYRVEQLRSILLVEEPFPHGYLFCRAHGTATRKLWDARRNMVLHSLDGNTDVAEAMKSVKTAVADCPDCKRGCNSSIELLRVRFPLNHPPTVLTFVAMRAV